MLFRFNPTYPLSLTKLTLALIELRDYISNCHNDIICVIKEIHLAKNTFTSLLEKWIEQIMLNPSVLILVIFVEDTRYYKYKESLASIITQLETIDMCLRLAFRHCVKISLHEIWFTRCILQFFTYFSRNYLGYFVQGQFHLPTTQFFCAKARHQTQSDIRFRKVSNSCTWMSGIPISWKI